MTYKELLSFLNSLSQEKLEDTVTIKLADEFYSINKVLIVKETDEDSDILDIGHAYLEAY